MVKSEMVLKRRIIPVMLLEDGRLTKTISFGPGRDVGDPVKSAKVYSDQYADELVFLNISREHRGIAPLVDLLERVSEVCFMPLTLGGGITTLQDAKTLIQGGADKVVVNSAAYANPALLTEIAESFGNQALMVSIDCRRVADGEWQCFSHCGRQQQGVPMYEHLQQVIAAGAGEILIQSIDQDGRMQGFDIALLAAVAQRVAIPVIGCGGAGHYEHLRDAFLGANVDALAMGSLFNFTDSNPIRAKAFLSNYSLQFKVV